MENDQNPDRVKDPTGQYERNMPIFRSGKPGDGVKLVALIVGIAVCLAVVGWGLRNLFG